MSGTAFERYGRWAVVAGASAGLGAAFATALARRGIDLVLVARQQALLEPLADRLRQLHGVEIRTLALDLAEPGALETLSRATATLEVGLAIYNAAFAPLAPLVDTPIEALARVVDTNVRAPLLFARTFAPAMTVRRRGAIVLMSSLAGLVGTPRLAAYGASKAFALTLAEAMWAELKPHGVDVVAVCAGAIRTPGYDRAAAGRSAPGTMSAQAVVARTLAALGQGPRLVPGWINRVAAWVLGRLAPRRLAIAVMAGSTRGLS